MRPGDQRSLAGLIWKRKPFSHNFSQFYRNDDVANRYDALSIGIIPTTGASKPSKDLFENFMKLMLQ